MYGRVGVQSGCRASAVAQSTELEAWVVLAYLRLPSSQLTGRVHVRSSAPSLFDLGDPLSKLSLHTLITPSLERGMLLKGDSDRGSSLAAITMDRSGMCVLGLVRSATRASDRSCPTSRSCSVLAASGSAF